MTLLYFSQHLIIGLSKETLSLHLIIEIYNKKPNFI